MHDWVAVVVSIIAAIISVISLTRQTRLGHEATTQKLIHDQYQEAPRIILTIMGPSVAPGNGGIDWLKCLEKQFRSNIRQRIEASACAGAWCAANRVRGRLENG